MCNNDCNNCPRHICDCRPRVLKENNKYKQTLKTCAELCGKLQNYMRAIDKIRKYCNECNLKYDSIACDILNIIDETI